jgi:Uri superfamily endonuclease
MENIPVESGSYLLLARLWKDISIRIGALGVHNFEHGYYFYCGSACGSGGLKARINHHLRLSNHPSWHFDYLKPDLMIETAWFTISGEALECSFVKRLSSLPRAKQPVRFFGSRDCRNGCHSHLVRFSFNEDIENIYELINSAYGGIRAAPVFQIC